MGSNSDKFFKKNQEISKHWLYLALLSLAIAGFYSILIVALRTPGLKDLIEDKNFFRTALIIHVDFSVLIWFLSCCLIFITSIVDKKNNYILKISYLVSYIGVALIFISPFVSESEPIINNYVPILHNIYFILGLSLFAASIALSCVASLINYKNLEDSFLAKSSYLLAVLIVISMLAVHVTFWKMKAEFDFEYNDLYNYYEKLFWAGGHLLQFAYTQILILSWIVIAEKCKLKILPENTIFMLLILNFAFVLVGFYPFPFYNINEADFTIFFTQHMIYLGGILPSIIGVFLIYSLITSKASEQDSHLRLVLIFSLVLFFVGGAVGILIKGTNVTIPAHYHGSIIGITIALTGMVYYLLNIYNFGQVKIKLAKWQVYLYSVGQLIHIFGLSRSGGYGVMRKDPNSYLSFQAKLNMGLMGAGGLIAIIGGIVFVVLCYLAIIHKTNRIKSK